MFESVNQFKYACLFFAGGFFAGLAASAVYLLLYSIRSDSCRYIRGVFLFDSNNACAGVYADLFFARRRGIRENFT